MADRDKYLCRVCGLDHYPDMPWGDNGKRPSHDICPCCGIEFGYEDDGSVADLADDRKHWVEVKNCKWFTPKRKPADWDMPAQVRGIAAEFSSPDDEKLIDYYLEYQKPS
jgi:hypothetical protein